MNNLNTEMVTVRDGNAITDSLILAKVFGKDHYHVLEIINAKMSSPENSGVLQKMIAPGT